MELLQPPVEYTSLWSGDPRAASYQHASQTTDHRHLVDGYGIGNKDDGVELDENHHDDVICLGSRPSTWSTSPSTTNALPKAAASATTRTSTTGPRLRQRRDLPIFKTSPESSSSARTAPTSPTTAERQKAILTTTAQKAQSETKTTPIVPTGRLTRLRYAEVGWLGSSGAQRQAVYGCLNTSGQLRYWSCSAQDDGGSIRHEEISFCPEFQGLSQDDIRKKLLEKIHRAARRNVQDES
ncbi:hypothetical protein CABS03_15308 [Colletotrichum abscissum]